MTLYRHFPSKEALFEGLVTATCKSIREGLENAPTADTDKPVASRLADETQRLHLGADRAGWAGALPIDRGGRLAFSGTLLTFSSSPACALFGERIAELLETGGVRADRSRQVAADLVALALGDAYQRALLGIAEEGDGEAFAQQIEAAVKYGLSRLAESEARPLPECERCDRGSGIAAFLKAHKPCREQAIFIACKGSSWR